MTRILMSATFMLLCCPAFLSAAEAPAKKKYNLCYLPQAGLRIAYEQTLQSEVNATASAINGRSANRAHKIHRQVIVKSEEFTEFRDGNPVGMRITYGPNCWWAQKEDDKPTKKTNLVYANKTVNLKITAEDKIEQDFGVQPTGQLARLIRNSMIRGGGLVPDKPVAIGERWRGDEGLRPLLDLYPKDTISAIMTLKAVREQQGREVADIHCTAGIITRQFGLHMEMNIEGMLNIDVLTGTLIGCHLKGTMTLTKGVGNAGERNVISMNGTGKVELHQIGRFVEDESAATDAGE